MNDLVGQVLPQAAGMAISPVPIVSTILILLSPRAATAAPAFLAGWIVGMASAVTVFTVLASLQPAPDPDQRRLLLGAVDLTLGIMLVLLALQQWHARPGPGEPARMPGWLARVTTLGPVPAAGLAFVLAGINPKNLLLAASAGLTIGTASTDHGAAVVATFTGIASVTVAVPVAAFLVAGRRMAEPLDRLRVWLEHNSPAIVATLLGALGVGLAGKGIVTL